MSLWVSGVTSALLLSVSFASSPIEERRPESSVQETKQAGELCLDRVCGEGEYCCNPSCGYCAPIGFVCTTEVCYGEPCGDHSCSPRQYCCNISCGICAPMGGFCTLQECHDPWSAGAL